MGVPHIFKMTISRAISIQQERERKKNVSLKYVYNKVEHIQASLVPDHHNKVNMAIKQVT